MKPTMQTFKQSPWLHPTFTSSGSLQTEWFCLWTCLNPSKCIKSTLCVNFITDLSKMLHKSTQFIRMQQDGHTNLDPQWCLLHLDPPPCSFQNPLLRPSSKHIFCFWQKNQFEQLLIMTENEKTTTGHFFRPSSCQTSLWPAHAWRAKTRMQQKKQHLRSST